MGCSPWSQRHAGVHQRERGVQPPPLEGASLRLKPYTRRAARNPFSVVDLLLWNECILNTN